MLDETVRWEDGVVVLIDQTKLPTRLEYVRCRTVSRVARAIRTMEVRGAPAIGVTAALGIALAAYRSRAGTREEIIREIRKAADLLKSTRPTAVNLFWAVDRVVGRALNGRTVEEVRKLAVDEALKIHREDVETNRRIGEVGAKLIREGDSILTHCNAGSLATVKYGTVLAPMYIAWERGVKFHVYADETRPLLQGARLTAWELSRAGIPVTVITDNTAGFLMQLGKVDKIFVGADRILRDGTVYNKIGTYSLAVLAKHHGIPFYVFAPTSTIDPRSKPEDVKIEERNPREIYMIGRKRIAPREANFINYAFDRTPPDLLTGIVTEKGILKPPFEKSISEAVD